MNRVRSRLPGQARVYVYVEGEFSYERWIAALRAGRTFVTDGPMFEFTVDDKMAGGAVQLDEPGVVRVRSRVESQYPLSVVEIVHDGEVIYSEKTETAKKVISVDHQVPVKRSGWIAVRASGPAHPDQPTGGLYGHTSAVYLEVRDRPVDASADALYFVNWIERLRTDIRRRNRIPSRHQVHVESQISQARKVFNALLPNEDSK